MKGTLFIATYNKNKLLSNTLFSIARQKSSIPFEVCIIDDCSDDDPEPIIRRFIPDAKYKRLDKRHGSDVVNKYSLDLASDDSDILIRQSADVMHAEIDTIEQLCNGVNEKQICMAAVSNTDPPHNAYKNVNKHWPKLHKQHQSGVKRSKPGKSYYFFLGAIIRSEYESLNCTKVAHCDAMLGDELKEKGFVLNYPKGLIGFHQEHKKTLIPCSRHNDCPRETCLTKKGCKELGWNSFEDYLRAKRR
jgi:hypothetical protein